MTYPHLSNGRAFLANPHSWPVNAHGVCFKRENRLESRPSHIYINIFTPRCSVNSDFSYVFFLYSSILGCTYSSPSSPHYRSSPPTKDRVRP